MSPWVNQNRPEPSRPGSTMRLRSAASRCSRVSFSESPQTGASTGIENSRPTTAAYCKRRWHSGESASRRRPITCLTPSGIRASRTSSELCSSDSSSRLLSHSSSSMRKSGLPSVRSKSASTSSGAGRSQEAGGWTSAKMLLDVYGHYMPTESAGFADAITAPDAPPRHQLPQRVSGQRDAQPQTRGLEGKGWNRRSEARSSGAGLALAEQSSAANGRPAHYEMAVTLRKISDLRSRGGVERRAAAYSGN